MSRKVASAKLNTPGHGDEHDLSGMLAREVPMRLIDISRTGCLLESRQRIEDGTVGELQLQVQRETFADDIRVTRCLLVEGSGKTESFDFRQGQTEVWLNPPRGVYELRLEMVNNATNAVLARAKPARVNVTPTSPG